MILEAKRDDLFIDDVHACLARHCTVGACMKNSSGRKEEALGEFTQFTGVSDLISTIFIMYPVIIFVAHMLWILRNRMRFYPLLNWACV